MRDGVAVLAVIVLWAVGALLSLGGTLALIYFGVKVARAAWGAP